MHKHLRPLSSTITRINAGKIIAIHHVLALPGTSANKKTPTIGIDSMGRLDAECLQESTGSRVTARQMLYK